jgi:peptide-methionine (R)-S-oxide reductase
MVIAMIANERGQGDREDRTPVTRRRLLIGTAIGLSGASITRGWGAPAGSEAFEVTHTHAEWRKLSTPDQFATLRTSATVRSFAGPLVNEKRRGNFACMGRDLDLFSSTTKFESGTGWLSLWAPLEGAIGTITA